VRIRIEKDFVKKSIIKHIYNKDFGISKVGKVHIMRGGKKV